MRLSIPAVLGASALLSAAVVAGVAYQQSAASHAPAGSNGLSAANPQAVAVAPAPARLAPALPVADTIAARPPTVEEVGDVDSFGRPVRWLGVTQMNVDLDTSCPGDAIPNTACAVLNPSPAATTFQFDELASIVLPPKAADSLLCYWFSPYLTIQYNNATASPVVARLRYQPVLTIENEVLANPALVDPTTGLPFNGRLTTGMTSSERFEVPLPAATGIVSQQRDSATCIAGFLTRRSLVQVYGLSEAQARQFFRKRTTVRMGLRGGFAQHVESASLVFGLRIVGD